MNGDPLIELQDQTKAVLRKHLGPPGPVALLDFPIHKNAGDSLIYLGETAYLDGLGYDVRYIAHQHSYDPDRLRAAAPEGPVLIHGGGNFGDRYPVYQDHRERIAADLPDRKLVQLPQSIEFVRPAEADRSHAVLRKHPDFTLLLRETPSLRLAERLFPDVARDYCPDTAFGVGRLQLPSRAPERDVVWLLRTDSESVPRGFTFGPRDLVLDWTLGRRGEASWWAWRLPERVGKKIPAARPATDRVQRRSYDGLAWTNVREAIRTLGRGRVLVTDRLHAAVLGGLLGMPVIALDNNYGKVSSIYADYLRQLSNVFFAESTDQVSQQLAVSLP